MTGGSGVIGALLGYVAVSMMLVLVLAAAFGRGPIRLSPVRPGSDQGLLGSRPGTYGGIVAALVAAGALANLADPSRGRVSVLPLVFALGVAVIVSGSGMIREATYLVLGLAATSASLAELFAGACGDAMPSTLATLLAVLPAILMVGVSATTAMLRLRIRHLLEDASRTALAAFAMLELGTFATNPRGLPLLDEVLSGGGVWFPVLALLLLCLIAGLVGIHPRYGADIAAVGLLTAAITLGGFESPCGPQLGASALVAVTFGAGAFAASLFRRRT